MWKDAGELLVEEMIISEDQLQQALTDRVQRGGTLIATLLRLGFVNEGQLVDFFSTTLRLHTAERKQFENLPEFLTKLVPEEIVRDHVLTPIMLHQGVLYVAMSDPTDRVALEEIAFRTGYKTTAVVAPYSCIAEAIDSFFGMAPPKEPHSSSDSSDAVFSTGQLDSFQAVRASKEDSGPTHPRPHAVVTGQFYEDVTLEEKPQAQRLEVVESENTELDDLFLGLTRDDSMVIHLTRKKETDPDRRSNITEAIQSVTSEDSGAETPNQLKNTQKKSLKVTTIFGNEKLIDSASRAFRGVPEFETENEKIEPIHNADVVRAKLLKAKDRDQVAVLLVSFALSLIQRVALFMVRKDSLLGWVGGGEGIVNTRIKEILIPLHTPSVFKTVRETETDYFGRLPKTATNDSFISALGDLRPQKVLLVPIAVHHKPICILYGDCGSKPEFSFDLSPIHLLVPDVSDALERLILTRKKIIK